MRKVHRFENGIRVFDDHLSPAQRERYSEVNLHEPEEEAIFIDAVQRLPKSAVFVSIGTAIGYYAILAKRLRSDLEVHCFDPLPAHVECLKENIGLNDLPESDFHIHPFAVSDRSGKVKLLENSYASAVEISNPTQRGLWILRRIFQHRPVKKTIKSMICVQSITLSGLFGLVSRKRIDLLQIDIQGHELQVLKEFFGSSRSLEAAELLLGTHGPDIHTKCRALFLKNNYRILVDSPTCPGQPDGIIHCCLQN